ncbi:hypothetical protein FLAV_00369 [Flavobacteriales bacterium]|nr:hypothetical protein FLAV_00369 [Flavobacteriales bacterium]
MRKNNKKKSLPVWLILVAILIVIVLHFFTENEKVKRHSNNLKKRIREKEDVIVFLKYERIQLLQIKNELTISAYKWFKVAKVVSLIVLIGFALICCTTYNMDFWEAISWIIGIVGVVYYSITIVVQNKLGDFNQTLKLAESYFMDYSYKKGRFKLCMIEIIEDKITAEECELNELKNQLQKF